MSGDFTITTGSTFGSNFGMISLNALKYVFLIRTGQRNLNGFHLQDKYQKQDHDYIP